MFIDDYNPVTSRIRLLKTYWYIDTTEPTDWLSKGGNDLESSADFPQPYLSTGPKSSICMRGHGRGLFSALPKRVSSQKRLYNYLLWSYLKKKKLVIIFYIRFNRKKTLKHVISNVEHSHSWREMGLIRPILMELYLSINLHSGVNVNNRAFARIILFLHKEHNI